MVSASRPAALALLSCCLVFGILLGLTGVVKEDSRATAAPSSPAHKEARPQQKGLRSAEGRDDGGARSLLAQARRARNEAAEREKLGQEALEFLTWPQDDPTARGLWGPTEEERDELMLNSADNAAVGLAWPKRDAGGDDAAVWPGTEAMFGENVNWDRLVLEMDDSDSLSFSFDL